MAVCSQRGLFSNSTSGMIRGKIEAGCLTPSKEEAAYDGKALTKRGTKSNNITGSRRVTRIPGGDKAFVNEGARGRWNRSPRTFG